MEIEHDFPAPKAVMPSFERAEQYFSHEESQSLLWTTEDSFFEGAESVEGMNLDFLVSDFSPPSWAVSKSNENNSSTPLTLEMTMEKTGCSKSQLISPPESLPSTALSQSQGSSAEQSAEQPQKAVCLNIDNLETASASAPSKEVTRNEKSYQHLPLLLETTLRFYFKAPSATQAPISDALRLAKDGLQAIQCCLREFYLSSRAQASSSGLSSHDPSPPEPDSESSSILACIILMEKVLFCYDSLLKRRSGPGDVSSPYAPSPAPSSTSTSNPTASSSSGHHCMQPIFIGDFEVEDKASWKMILDAVVAAQKQEARSTISKLEDWASDLAGKGKNEGRLAISFLEQLKRKFHD
ncbi:uncharacterized protein LY89DRAFT_207988 [Mollisia scopiformis]|uniref:Uncharacterized protein n=1 Tax=Mollisia scopiformis TaxID=149040 RepID=A0A194WWZ4_MOLSC|nr:uncharacterized protein LY89DRAFT_207988 [Mollisia scopiformis]KUJ12455.1 hypothetical protein LY89DRAFT_207988 [Mollisia scopiformis]